ncbi:MAG: type II toxin-antitoxin system RelE/ParE family toxin [Betaproteobacteria bacterium]|nr:type II toxin-antitoxin system RelE/ParE family toxin [Betaproteobacteria bacterium]MDH5221912.1 type II toxin-antitoxin system RelE/ParE family toxin [Betaproteobacteria bacterium]MDH5352704.1 type II toxin-antitoxin system RelE/ParE family toxin [Betaproteobacteria bacterium]
MALSAVRVLEYLDSSGLSPFRRWFDGLDATASARVGAYLYRLEEGNFSRVEGAGGGVFELRVDFGPGYRVYFGKDGETVVILLGGSTKKRQSAAINRAREAWQDYKRRKR